MRSSGESSQCGERQRTPIESVRPMDKPCVESDVDEVKGVMGLEEQLTEKGGASATKRQRHATSDEGDKQSTEETTSAKRRARGTEDEENVIESELDEEARAANEEGGTEPAADAEVKMRKDTHEPTEEVRKAHEARGHVPYRSWCRACIAGRMPNWAHTSSPEPRTRREVPEVHGDYLFFRDTKGAESVATLVLKERDRLSLAAHVIPMKGGASDWTVQQVVRDIRRWGIRNRLTIRCDQEPALVDFFNEVAKVRGEANEARTFIEHSPVGDSQKNGFIENGCKAIEGVVRSIKFTVEEKMGQKLLAATPAFAWLVEHAADVQNKYKIGVDGKTPYERGKGKPWRGDAVEFGARVHHRATGKPQGGSLQWRWLEGTYLGSRAESTEHYVALDDGRVVRAGAVRPFPEGSRWRPEHILGVTGYPWAPTGTIREINEPGVPEPFKGEPGGKAREPVSRNMPILTKHIQKFGYTDGCRKCRAMRSRDNSQPTLGHSAECRERIRRLAMQDEEFCDRARAGEARTRRDREPEESAEVERKRARVGDGGVADEAGPSDPKQSGTSSAASSSGQGGVTSTGGDFVNVDDIPVPTVDDIDDVPPVRVSRDEEVDRDRSSEPEPKRIRRTLCGLEESEEINEVLREECESSLAYAVDRKWEAVCRSEDYDVCEIFSPPRVCDRARARNMKGGWSLDLNHRDPVSGRTWDLSDEKVVSRIKGMMRRDKPRLLVVSPPCMGGPESQRLRHADKLFATAVDLCLYQAKLDGLFILQHPQASKAWRLGCVSKLLVVRGLVQTTFDMCQYGMVSRDGEGEGHVQKPTTILSNSTAVAEKLHRRCDGNHQHLHLGGSRANRAVQYPVAVCDAILDGLMVESRARCENKLLNQLTSGSDMCDPMDYPVDDVEIEVSEKARDARTHELIRKARQAELDTFHSIPVFEYADKREAEGDPEAIIIDTTWVDKNKGTVEKPEWASRLCAREFAGNDVRDDLFAPTPPLMATKLLLSECASQQGRGGDQPRIMILDVKRAFLHGMMKRKVYIRLLAEDPRATEKHILGRLIRAMYGTRDDAQIWGGEVRKMLIGMG